jgi:uncharacterized membrane protein YeiH
MDTFWFLVEAVGTLSFAISGIIEARRRQMDLVGVYAAAILTAFGGGTLRDLMLDRHPLFWINYQWWPVVILGLALLTWPLFRDPEKTVHARTAQLAIDLTDALGLALCAALGASITLRMQPDKWFIAAIMAVVSSVFGGVLRDIVCNEIPNVFKRSQLYATAAFIGGFVYVVLDLAAIAPGTCFGAAFATTLGLRLAALRFNLRLPA